MRIGVITATSGERPHLLKQCIHYVQRQTVKSSIHLIMNGPETLKTKYKNGLDQLKDKVDIVFFMEDDDYYPRNYLEKMLEYRDWAGDPDIFGIKETFFYHPEFKAYWYKLNEKEEACAFQTCVKTSAIEKIDWSLIDSVFVDAGLWRQLEGSTIELGQPLSIGIKHGRGKTLASGHNKWFFEEKSKLQSNKEYAKFTDTWLREMIKDDAEFYEVFGANRNLV
jgi:hypothetical protein